MYRPTTTLLRTPTPNSLHTVKSTTHLPSPPPINTQWDTTLLSAPTPNSLHTVKSTTHFPSPPPINTQRVTTLLGAPTPTPSTPLSQPLIYHHLPINRQRGTTLLSAPSPNSLHTVKSTTHLPSPPPSIGNEVPPCRVPPPPTPSTLLSYSSQHNCYKRIPFYSITSPPMTSSNVLCIAGIANTITSNTRDQRKKKIKEKNWMHLLAGSASRMWGGIYVCHITGCSHLSME